MEKTFCDKCGKEIVGEFFLIQTLLENTLDEEVEKDFGLKDICPDCYKEMGIYNLLEK